jgi:hypothetical protein
MNALPAGDLRPGFFFFFWGEGWRRTTTLLRLPG